MPGPGPLKDRDYYTTGEMAVGLGCSQQTVIRRIDAGLVPAYRLPTDGRPRRCSKVAFRRFLQRRGISQEMLDKMEEQVRPLEEIRNRRRCRV